MKRMEFGYNKLGGSIPPSWANFSKLTNLSLSFNNISGSIPSLAGMWPNLLEFDIAVNNISGTIPEELYQVAKLDSLILNNNRLQGSLSESIGNLGLLRGSIDVSYNRLDGTIPKALASLSAVTSIYLDSNLFSGALPCELAAMSLKELNISMNNFDTTLPECYLDSTSNIVILYATYANLTGPLPEPFAMSSKLTTLALSGNPTEGTLPGAWGSATNLVNLEMDKMELSGTIPLSYNRSFSSFSVIGNHLTGEIPRGMFGMGNFYFNGNIGLTGCYKWYYSASSRSLYCQAYNTSLCCISSGYCCKGIPDCPDYKACYLPPTTPSPLSPSPLPVTEDAAPEISGPAVLVASLAALSIFMTMY